MLALAFLFAVAALRMLRGACKHALGECGHRCMTSLPLLGKPCFPAPLLSLDLVLVRDPSISIGRRGLVEILPRRLP